MPVTSPFLLLLKRKERKISILSDSKPFSPSFKVSFFLSQKNTVEVTNELFICCSGSATTAMTCEGIYLCKAWLLCCKRLKTTYSPAYRLKPDNWSPRQEIFHCFFLLPSPSPLFFWFTVLCCWMNNTFPAAIKQEKFS